jgi:hypothetical protein
MKGQILQTLQSTGSSLFAPPNYNMRIWLVRANHPKSYGRFLCSLLLLVGLLFEQNLPAGEPAIPLSQNAIKALSEAASDENWLVINPSSTNTVLHDAPIVGPTNLTEL